MSLAHPLHPGHLSVQEYLAWGETAGSDLRTELLEGEICEMSPESDDHSSIAWLLAMEFVEEGFPKQLIRTGGTTLLSERDAVIPDVAVVKQKPRGRYRLAEETALVAEIAHSTIRRDVALKAPLYAKAGIPEFWIVDAEQRAMMQHTGPRADGTWESTRQVGADGIVGSTINGVAVELSVAALFAGLSPEEPG